MTKKITLQFVFFLSLLFLQTTNLFASHWMGGDITYTCIDSNRLYVRVVLYRDCGTPTSSTATAPTSISVNFNSASCGQNVNFTLNRLPCFTPPGGTPCEVSPVCPALIAQSCCVSRVAGCIPGVQSYIFADTVRLPARCRDWRISFTNCCRNGAITNLSSPSSQSLFLYSSVNNTLSSCNSSPQFTTILTPYICVGEPYCYSPGAYDPDGDSLYYQLVSPLTSATAAIPHAGGYTPTTPVSAVPGTFRFDPLTGQVCFTPNMTQVSVISFKVYEFRGGVIIDSMNRDMQLVVLNLPGGCGSAGLDFNWIDRSSVRGGVYLDSATVQVCPGDTLRFHMTGTGDTVFMTSNIAVAIPGTSFDTNRYGVDSTLGEVVWFPTAADTGLRLFTVSLSNIACPLSATNSFTLRINVLKSTFAGPDKYYCTGGGPIRVDVQGGSRFSWTSDRGTLDIVGAAPDSSYILVAPTTTTTYYVQSDLSTSCKNRDTITVFNVPNFILNAGILDDTICLGGSTTVYAATGPSGAGPFTYSWNSSTTLLTPTDSSSLIIPLFSTNYWVEATSNVGCKLKDTVRVVIDGIAPTVLLSLDTNRICPGYPVSLTSSILSLSCGPNSIPTSSFICDPANIRLVDVGTATTNTAITTPYQATSDARVQYLFRASELIAAGMSAGTITDLWFDFQSSAGVPVENLSIKLGCTNLTAFPTPLTFLSGLTEVLSLASYTPPAPPALTTFYDWDGVSNLVVEVCYNGSSARFADVVNYSSTSYTSVLYRTGTGTAVGCNLVTPTGSTLRPNMNIIMCRRPTSAYTYTWTPSPVSCATCPNTIATPLTSTTYTLRVSDGRCVGDNRITVLVDSAHLVTASADTSICANDSVQLNAFQTALDPLVCQNMYTVSSVPFAPITGSGTGINLADDAVSANQPIGFPFSFFCQNYTQFRVSSNGFVTFDLLSGANGCCTGQILPNATTPNNLIAYAWEDLDPNNGTNGQIGYYVAGTAPNRILVINFNAVSHFNAPPTIDPITSQIHLYESNGNIEIHTTRMPGNPSGGWVGHTMGIENVNGTLGYTVPGRNSNATWTATNEAWRFSPVYTGGDTVSSYTWTPGVTLNNANISNPIATPVTSTKYVVAARFNSGCIAYDTVNVNVNTVPLSITTAPSDSICFGDSTRLIATSTGTFYNWTPSASLGTPSTSNTLAFPLTNTTYALQVTDSIGCLGFDTVTVFVRDTLSINIGGDSTICSSDRVSLTPGIFASYVWSPNGETTSSITVGRGTYSVEIHDGNCNYFSNSVVIDTFATPIITFANDTAICSGSCLDYAAPAGFTSYRWMNGDTNRTIRLCAITNSIYFTCIDRNGCLRLSDTIQLSILNPPVDSMQRDYSFCEGRATILDAKNAGSTYLWTPGLETTQTINVSTAGTYVVRISRANCVLFDTAVVRVLPTPSIDTSLSNLITCCVQVPLVAGPEGPGYPTYQWSNGANSNSITVTRSGVYTVTATSTNGCFRSHAYNITIICIDPIAAADPSAVNRRESTNLTVTTNPDLTGYLYNWNPVSAVTNPTISNPTTNGLDTTTTFFVSVTYPILTTSGDSCVESDTITVSVLNPGTFVIPDAFTPNGDGVNDYFYPVVNGEVTIKEFKIYNRWGALVHDNPNTPGWDGKYSGAQQNTGTFVYYLLISVPDSDNPSLTKQLIKQGSLTLIR